MKVFDNFDDFYAWYINELKAKVPNFEKLFSEYSQTYKNLQNKKYGSFLEAVQEQFKSMVLSQAIINAVPRLNRDEWSYLKRVANEIQKIPSDVHIIYGRDAYGGTDETFFSRFNTFNKKIELSLPTLAYYYTAYPPILKAALVHELGHILKRDIFVNPTQAHSQCSNIAMDLRINAGIDSDAVRQLSKCMFFIPSDIPINKVKAVLPEEIFPEIGLSEKAGAYTWDLIHEHLHLKDSEKDKPDEKLEQLLKESKKLQQEVEKMKTGRKGQPMGGMAGGMQQQKKIGVGSYVKQKSTGKYGKIVGQNPDGTWQVQEMTKEGILAETAPPQKFMTLFAKQSGNSGKVSNVKKEDLVLIELEDEMEQPPPPQGGEGEEGEEGEGKEKKDQQKGKGKGKKGKEQEEKEEKEGEGEKKEGEEAEGEGEKKEGEEGEGEGEEGEKEGEEGEKEGEGKGEGKGEQKEATEKDAKRSIRNAERSLENIKGKLSDEKDKQKVDEAMDKLNKTRDKLDSGEYKTPQDIIDEVAKISQDALNGISETLNKTKEELDQHFPQRNPIIQENKSCGTLDKQPEYSDEDKIIGNSRVDDAIAEVKENPFDYPNLKDILNTNIGYGSKHGGGLTEIKIQGWVTHDWIQQLKIEIKNFLKSRRKVKEDYDYPEMTARGIGIVKTKSKKHKKQKTIYFILDTSGSMFWYSSKGVPLVQVMTEYLLPLFLKYEGELWENDTMVSHKIDFRDLKSNYFKDAADRQKSGSSLKIRGMGGTEFIDALKQIRQMKESKEVMIGGKKKKMKHSPEFLTILATDSDADWNAHKGLFPEDFILLTIKGRNNYPALNADKNQKIIFLDVDED